MANPVFKQKLLSPVSLTVTNLHSLGDGSFWQSNDRDNEANDLAISVDVYVELHTTTTAGDANGYATVYLAENVKGTAEYTGEASGSEGSYAPGEGAAENAPNLRELGTIHMPADETTAREFAKLFKIDDPPANYSIVIENQSGAALASSGNEVVLLPKQLQRAAS